MSVDTPGDLKVIEQLLGKPLEPCEEYEKVKKHIKAVNGREIVHILCPAGCIKTQADVERKCKIRYAATR